MSGKQLCGSPFLDSGNSGEEALQVELGIRRRNVQYILVGDFSQSSSSAKLLEGWDHLV